MTSVESAQRDFIKDDREDEDEEELRDLLSIENLSLLETFYELYVDSYDDGNGENSGGEHTTGLSRLPPAFVDLDLMNQSLSLPLPLHQIPILVATPDPRKNESSLLNGFFRNEKSSSSNNRTTLEQETSNSNETSSSAMDWSHLALLLPEYSSKNLLQHPLQRSLWHCNEDCFDSNFPHRQLPLNRSFPFPALIGWNEIDHPITQQGNEENEESVSGEYYPHYYFDLSISVDAKNDDSHRVPTSSSSSSSPSFSAERERKARRLEWFAFNQSTLYDDCCPVFGSEKNSTIYESFRDKVATQIFLWKEDMTAALSTSSFLTASQLPLPINAKIIHTFQLNSKSPFLRHVDEFEWAILVISFLAVVLIIPATLRRICQRFFPPDASKIVLFDIRRRELVEQELIQPYETLMTKQIAQRLEQLKQQQQIMFSKFEQKQLQKSASAYSMTQPSLEIERKGSKGEEEEFPEMYEIFKESSRTSPPTHNNPFFSLSEEADDEESDRRLQSPVSSISTADFTQSMMDDEPLSSLHNNPFRSNRKSPSFASSPSLIADSPSAKKAFLSVQPIKRVEVHPSPSKQRSRRLLGYETPQADRERDDDDEVRIADANQMNNKAKEEADAGGRTSPMINFFEVYPSEHRDDLLPTTENPVSSSPSARDGTATETKMRTMTSRSFAFRGAGISKDTGDGKTSPEDNDDLHEQDDDDDDDNDDENGYDDDSLEFIHLDAEELHELILEEDEEDEGFEETANHQDLVEEQISYENQESDIVELIEENLEKEEEVDEEKSHISYHHHHEAGEVITITSNSSYASSKMQAGGAAGKEREEDGVAYQSIDYEVNSSMHVNRSIASSTGNDDKNDSDEDEESLQPMAANTAALFVWRYRAVQKNDQDLELISVAEEGGGSVRLAESNDQQQMEEKERQSAVVREENSFKNTATIEQNNKKTEESEYPVKSEPSTSQSPVKWRESRYRLALKTGDPITTTATPLKSDSSELRPDDSSEMSRAFPSSTAPLTPLDTSPSKHPPSLSPNKTTSDQFLDTHDFYRSEIALQNQILMHFSVPSIAGHPALADYQQPPLHEKQLDTTAITTSSDESSAASSTTPSRSSKHIKENYFRQISSPSSSAEKPTLPMHGRSDLPLLSFQNTMIRSFRTKSDLLRNTALLQQKYNICFPKKFPLQHIPYSSSGASSPAQTTPGTSVTSTPLRHPQPLPNESPLKRTPRTRDGSLAVPPPAVYVRHERDVYEKLHSPQRALRSSYGKTIPRTSLESLQQSGALSARQSIEHAAIYRTPLKGGNRREDGISLVTRSVDRFFARINREEEESSVPSVDSWSLLNENNSSSSSQAGRRRKEEQKKNKILLSKSYDDVSVEELLDMRKGFNREFYRLLMKSSPSSAAAHLPLSAEASSAHHKASSDEVVAAKDEAAQAALHSTPQDKSSSSSSSTAPLKSILKKASSLPSSQMVPLSTSNSTSDAAAISPLRRQFPLSPLPPIAISSSSSSSILPSSLSPSVQPDIRTYHYDSQLEDSPVVSQRRSFSATHVRPSILPPLNRSQSPTLSSPLRATPDKNAHAVISGDKGNSCDNDNDEIEDEDDETVSYEVLHRHRRERIAEQQQQQRAKLSRDA